jgi:hypothetical protein
MGARGLCSFFNHYPNPSSTEHNTSLFLDNVIFLNPECDLETFVRTSYPIIKYQYGAVSISIYTDQSDVAIYWAEKANQLEVWCKLHCCHCGRRQEPDGADDIINILSLPDTAAAVSVDAVSELRQEKCELSTPNSRNKMMSDESAQSTAPSLSSSNKPEKQRKSILVLCCVI